MGLQIGTAIQVLVTPLTVSLSCGDATGGTLPYSYQWHRSTQYNFIPSASTALAGQTALQAIDANLQPDTIYYYALVVTDSSTPSPLTAISNILGICTMAKANTTYSNPSVSDFQDYFDRDFPFGTDIDNCIRDKDILKAFQQANEKINPRLFTDQSEYANGYFLLSAHYLSVNLAQSSQGINGQYDHLLTSKGAGPVSAGISIPEIILKNPTFAGWAKTTYGYAYLAMILPRLAGPAASVQGQTKP